MRLWQALALCLQLAPQLLQFTLLLYLDNLSLNCVCHMVTHIGSSRPVGECRAPAIAALGPRPQPRSPVLAPALQLSARPVYIYSRLWYAGLPAAWAARIASACIEAEASPSGPRSIRSNSGRPCLRLIYRSTIKFNFAAADGVLRKGLAASVGRLSRRQCPSNALKRSQLYRLTSAGDLRSLPVLLHAI